MIGSIYLISVSCVIPLREREEDHGKNGEGLRVTKKRKKKGEKEEAKWSYKQYIAILDLSRNFFSSLLKTLTVGL